jgi:hypothetical protein
VTAPPMAAELLSVVVRGRFGLLNLSPGWLREKELIGDAEIEDVAYDLYIPGEASVFRAGWARVVVQREVLELQTQQQEESERIRDLAVGLLAAADEIPVSALGINSNAHFVVKNTAQWNAIGDNLVSNDIWDGVLPASGMRSVVFWTGRPDSYAGRIQIQIEPSFAYAPGIFIAYNDHYDLTKVEHQPSTRQEAQALARPENQEATIAKRDVAIEVLTNNWQPSMDRLAAVTAQVWQQGRSPK